MKSSSFVSGGVQTAEEFQALLDAAVDGVILIDHEGRIQAFNRAAERLFGYESQEARGNNVNMLLAAPAQDPAGPLGHPGRGREVEARRKDGSVFPIFLSVGAVEASNPPCFVGLVQDISAQRRAEEDTHRLQERLTDVARLATVGEMSAGIAHEINQPLTAVANYAQACDRLLGLPDADIEEIRGALKQITAQAVRAGDIIRRLRSLARNDTAMRMPTDINALIEELTPLIALDCKTHRLTYGLELARDLATPCIDREQIQQVILNLVRNAVEAVVESCSGNRELVIRTSGAADGAMEIAICDSGPGVLQSIGPRLFEPFCTSKSHGAGLGLAISRRIIRSHEGSLDYRPNIPSGACFVIRLPGVKQDKA